MIMGWLNFFHKDIIMCILWDHFRFAEPVFPTSSEGEAIKFAYLRTSYRS